MLETHRCKKGIGTAGIADDAIRKKWDKKRTKKGDRLN
jgi:hypothetical protein